MRALITLIVIVWLVVGVIAAAQRGYFGGKADVRNCNRAASAAVTIVAGPLNYVGVDPRISCKVPQPSK